jgi:hypothetical protein
MSAPASGAPALVFRRVCSSVPAPVVASRPHARLFPHSLWLKRATTAGEGQTLNRRQHPLPTTSLPGQGSARWRASVILTTSLPHGCQAAITRGHEEGYAQCGLVSLAAAKRAACEAKVEARGGATSHGLTGTTGIWSILPRRLC